MDKKYMRKCLRCGGKVFHASLSSLSHCRNGVCRKCSDESKNRVSYGEFNGMWKGLESIPKTYFSNTKYNANRRRIPFHITIMDMLEQFKKQNKKCIYTGLELSFSKGRKDRNKGTASLDRIDSSKGYEPKNIQWIHKDINWMKQDFDSPHFVSMCNLVSKTLEEKEQ